jgi:hypothetical protein
MATGWVEDDVFEARIYAAGVRSFDELKPALEATLQRFGATRVGPVDWAFADVANVSLDKVEVVEDEDSLSSVQADFARLPMTLYIARCRATMNA